MMKSAYIIWIVTPDGYSHSQCFDEVGDALYQSFLDLGFKAHLTRRHPLDPKNGFPKDAKVVILGAHLLHPDDITAFSHPIVWQLEQIPGHREIERLNSLPHRNYMKTLSAAKAVWDFSQANVERLKELGISAKLLKIGYHPRLTRIENSPAPDIDVLFYGSINERRYAILQDLRERGAKVYQAYDCYGVKRDALIARSKLILNVHYYSTALFEIVRCSYLAANRKIVVSETGVGDLPDYFIYAPYEELVDKTMSLLYTPEPDRRQISDTCFKNFKSYHQVDYLMDIL